MHRLLVITINISLLIICAIADNDFITNYASAFYLIQLVVFLVAVYKQNKNLILYLSPSFIAVLYISLNFIVGHYAVVNALGFDDRYYFAYESYSSISFITFYFLLCNFIVYLCIPTKKIHSLFTNYELIKVGKNDRNISLFYLIILFIILFTIGRFDISLSLLGGEGSFNYSFELTTAICIVLISRNKSIRYRALIYAVLLSVFISNHFDSKREILFLFIFLVFFEIVKLGGQFKLKIKSMIVTLIALTVFVYVILLSSILRGYGNYNVENPIDATRYVGEYITSDFAKDALVMNFEVTPVYGNSSNAVDYVYKNEVPLLYGSTFYKILFAPVPRSLYPMKPESMVNIYTSKFAPSFRAIGGSFPIILYSELFWNFHIIGLILLVPIFLILNRIYVWVLNSLIYDDINTGAIFNIFLYCTFIQFIRGAGLEMWIIYAALSIPLMMIYNFLFFKNKTNE